jgi:hypothetical protein
VAFGVIGEGRVDTSLRGPGVTAAGVDLAEDRHVDAVRASFDGGAQPREPAADDEKLMVRHAGPLS